MEAAQQALAERETAAAILYHFEDYDLRVENAKLRQALIELSLGGSKESEQGKQSTLDFSSLPPLPPQVVQLLRDCARQVKNLQRACQVLKEENNQLRSQLLSQEQQSKSGPQAGTAQEPTPHKVAIEDNVASASSVNVFSGSSVSTATPAVIPLPPSNYSGVAFSNAAQPNVPPAMATQTPPCFCPRGNPAVRAALKSQAEPGRIKEWLALMCSFDKAQHIPQRDMWQMYHAQCGSAESNINTFFSAVKATFPEVRMGKSPDGQYFTFGLFWRQCQSCANRVRS